MSLRTFSFSDDPKTVEMLSHDQNIAVNHEACLENDCHENCHLVSCELCLNCMSKANLENTHEAHLEHRRRGGFKRSFPKSEHDFSDLSLYNKVSQRWFRAKCLLDSEWCWRIKNENLLSLTHELSLQIYLHQHQFQLISTIKFSSLNFLVEKKKSWKDKLKKSLTKTDN